MEIWITIAVTFSSFAFIFASVALVIGMFLLHVNNPNRGRTGP